MIVTFLLAQAVTASTPVPLATDPTVTSLNGGVCVSGSVDTAAAIRVAWTITNATTGYTAKLYENGILVSTQATLAASMHWDKTVTGAVENGPVRSWVSNWTYRVDVVNDTTGAVVSSRTSATWAQDYGGCSTGGGV